MSRKELTIENLKADQACKPGRSWIEPLLEGGQKPTAEDWKSEPGYYLWAVGNGYDVSFEILDWCARADPATALKYAAALLTPETLDWCALLYPATALEYAAALLTPGTLDWCEAQAK